jgi:hypothetical protein
VRLCYLVLAHYNPEGVGRLVRTLSAGGDAVVVHVDAKADQAPFEQHAPASTFVRYETDRVDIRWGSSSIMRAQLHLMRTALREVPEADYYWLVSGDSYPLQSVTDAKAYLTANHPAEYLNVIRMPRDDLDKPIYRLSHFRFDFDARDGKYRLFWMALNRLARRPWKHHFRDMPPQGGSSWFTLTREATQYIVDYLDQNPRFDRYVWHSGAPEEWLPHTLLENVSRFAARRHGALFWADFRETTAPPKPPPLDDAHIELLKHLLVNPGEMGFPDPSPPLVARKFGLHSARIVDRVEAELWPIDVPKTRA